MRLLAPAKINLHLRIGPLGPDGFHPLLSWMCTVGFYDTLELSLRAGAWASSPPIEMTCDDPTLPCDATNLIVRAGAALADAIAADQSSAKSLEMPAVTIALQKRIPSGAGLGGGSSDGARAMLGLNRIWNARWSRDVLAALSARCGSDLPFFFHGGSSLCTGRGEVVKPTPPPVARWAALFLPDVLMPTPAVYRMFDQMRLGRPEDLLEERIDWPAWAQLPAAALLPRLVNDLETPAFAIKPELGRLRGELEAELGRPVRMSGSGSSLFTLFDDRPAAARAAEQFSGKYGLRALAVEISKKIPDDLNEL